MLFIGNIVLLFLYFNKEIKQDCPICETCAICSDFKLDDYVIENTKDYLEYLESIKMFFLQLSQVLATNSQF